MHPEARAALIREKVAASSDVPPTGWRYPPSYVVRIWMNDWTKRRLHAPDYPSAAALMKELIREGNYYLLVLEET
jgi:hypothetical protein